MIASAPAFRYISFIFRLLLGLVFLVAGISKVLHTADFTQTVDGYGLLPSSLVKPFSLALPWIEVLVGIYLLLGLFTRIAAVVSGALLVMFLVALGVQIARGHAGNCGCVIGLDNPVITFFLGGNSIGAWDLIRDGLLLAMAAVLAFAPRPLLSVDALLAARREADDLLTVGQEVA